MSNINFQKNISKIYQAYAASGGLVETDSRRVAQQHGCIFFALSGERFDGNDFVAAALESGASAAVADRAAFAGTDPRIMVVDNVLETLQQVAAMHRSRMQFPVIGLTGSNGKTTTKELIVRVLGSQLRVAATVGNFNNHIGVPLTLLSMPTEGLDAAVVEMGANHEGEIAALCRIARPDLGLITNVGVAHLEGFGSETGVRRAKGELYDFLNASGGRALFNAEDAVLSGMVRERVGLKAEPYSMKELGIDGGRVAQDGTVAFEFQGQAVATRIVGLYNLKNVAAAMAVGRAMGVDPAQAIQAVARYESDNNRSQRVVTAHNTLILDAYNANPSSMCSAVENFAALPVEHGMARIVVLGDMKELGERSEELHRQLLDLVCRAGMDRVIGVGSCMGRLVQENRNLTQNQAYEGFEDTDALQAYLVQHPIGRATILVKGSRSMGLERLTAYL